MNNNSNSNNTNSGSGNSDSGSRGYSLCSVYKAGGQAVCVGDMRRCMKRCNKRVGNVGRMLEATKAAALVVAKKKKTHNT